MSSPLTDPNTSSEYPENNVEMTGLSMHDSGTVHFRVRNLVDPRNPSRYSIFQVVNGEETAVNSGIAESWLDWGSEVAQSKHWTTYHAQLYLQRLPIRDFDPLMTVEIPCLKLRYVLNSKDGLTQWFYEPIQEGDDNPVDFTGKNLMAHGFFSQELLHVEWVWYTLLKRLGLHLEGRPLVCGKLQHHDHYRVYLFLATDNDLNTQYSVCHL